MKGCFPPDRLDVRWQQHFNPDHGQVDRTGQDGGQGEFRVLKDPHFQERIL